MKYFIDTEFIEGFHKPLFGKRRHFIDLISIGIVAEDGREYYAISSEYNYNKADNWIKENIILPIYKQEDPSFKQIFTNVKTFHRYSPNSKPNKLIAQEIFEFCSGDNIALEKVQHYNIDYSYRDISFYGYYCDYDWVLLCSLFGRMIDLPKGFPMYCIDLKQMLDEKVYDIYINSSNYQPVPSFANALNWIKSDRCYPDPFNEHNALADAKWNYQLYKFLQPL